MSSSATEAAHAGRRPRCRFRDLVGLRDPALLCPLLLLPLPCWSQNKIVVGDDLPTLDVSYLSSSSSPGQQLVQSATPGLLCRSTYQFVRVLRQRLPLGDVHRPVPESVDFVVEQQHRDRAAVLAELVVLLDRRRPSLAHRRADPCSVIWIGRPRSSLPGRHAFEDCFDPYASLYTSLSSRNGG